MLRAPGDGQVMRVELRTLQSWREATGAKVGDGVDSQGGKHGRRERKREGGAKMRRRGTGRRDQPGAVTTLPARPCPHRGLAADVVHRHGHLLHHVEPLAGHRDGPAATAG